MTDVNKAAERVTAFLDRRAEYRGVEPEFLLALDGNRFVLCASDLRALVAALPSEAPGPFMWYLKDGRMWHAGCEKEVIYDRSIFGLRCECGRTA